MDPHPIRHLPKRRHGGHRGTGTKYFMDCTAWQQHPAHLQTELLLRNVAHPPHTTILRAVATDLTLPKKNKRVVIKITPPAPTGLAHKEYDIGEQLHTHQVPGFIRYICLFKCLDDTAQRAPIVPPSASPQPYTRGICTASTPDQQRDVLVMPYISEGSLESYRWTSDNLARLHNLLLHTVCSLTVAYHRLGFIHGDLHLGNILFKRTQQPQIVYEIPSANPTASTTPGTPTPRPITLPTQGYKIVIMDFEKASLHPPGPQAHPQTHPQSHHAKFWKDILFLFKRTEATFDQYDTYYIDWDNGPLLDWTKEAIRRSLPPTHPTLQEVITRFQETRFYARPIQRMTYAPPPAPHPHPPPPTYKTLTQVRSP